MTAGQNCIKWSFKNMKSILTEVDLRNIIIESLRRILSESMGINEAMEEEVWKMMKYVRDNIQNSEEGIDGITNRKCKNLSYSNEIKGKKIRWSIVAIMYSNEEIDNGNILPSEGFSSSDGRRIFCGWIRFPMSKSGWYNSAEIADSIFHEMLHLLKYIKSGKEAKNKEFIAKTNSQYRESTGFEKSIATICYMSNGEEQDAFVNGFYGYLKQNFYEKMRLDIKAEYEESELFQKVLELRKAIEDVKNADQKNIEKYTEIERKKLVRLGENSVRRLNKKTVLILRHFKVFLERNNFESKRPFNILDF